MTKESLIRKHKGHPALGFPHLNLKRKLKKMEINAFQKRKRKVSIEKLKKNTISKNEPKTLPKVKKIINNLVQNDVVRYN